jgi:tetratricopeptide (TPR) repeat protein
MSTIADAFALAVRNHQAGHLTHAEQLYRQILQADPTHADAHHMLGVLALHMGRAAQAVMSIRQAISLKPQDATYHVNLGLALQGLGAIEDALPHFEEAVRLKPDFAEAHSNVASALFRLGKRDEAMAHYLQAIHIKPACAEAHCGLGVAFAEQDKLEKAVEHFRHALRFRPDFAEAHGNLAMALNNLGGKLQGQGRIQEAITHFQEALRLRPNLAEAHSSLGSALYCQGKLHEAMTSFEQALRLRPNFPEARKARAFLWLLIGDFDSGWPEFEWRLAEPRANQRHFTQPLWDGSELQGKTILLYAEHGLGDTFQCIRYVPLVKQRGGIVIVECQESLAPLLASVQGIDQLVMHGAAPPGFDFRAPLLSLPGIFHARFATIPRDVPYLHAAANLVERWQQILADVKKSLPDVGHRASDTGRSFRVGIAWQGNPAYYHDRQRSIPLEQFGRLATVPGVQLISLQKGSGNEQLLAVNCQLSDNRQLTTDNSYVLDLGNRLDVAAGAFMDTAAVMQNVDLIISSDTAVPHLAGALGIPVWVALPLVPDWRWLLEPEDSQWYPTMRLFRQTRFGHWDDVFERIARELHKATDETRIKLG